MMPFVSAFLLVVLSGAAVKATDITGDPTNLANWPPCAQKCIPLGFTAPASCNSLSNLTCVCTLPTFSFSIAECEQTSCSIEELYQIQNLSNSLCAPVGGFSASISLALSSYIATASLTPSGEPTYPADATGATGESAVSAILATATPAPNLGNPANILSYPLCAQTCQNESALAAGCDTATLACSCGVANRILTSDCEAVICSAEDQRTTNILAEELCDPLYSAVPSLGSAVSSALASATPIAAASKSKDPTNIANFPLCAQNCQRATILKTCVSLSNRTCVCKSTSLVDLNKCEESTCSASDVQLTSDLADALCNPVGGFAPNSSNTTNSTTASTPTPSPFTGGATLVLKGFVGWSLIALVGALGWQVLL